MLYIYIYIYIYDNSILRVNDLTLNLLTWRKWLAPNNASRQQMGFNSGIKGLINVLYENKQEFSASSWRSNQGYTKMHCQSNVNVFNCYCVSLSGINRPGPGKDYAFPYRLEVKHSCSYASAPSHTSLWYGTKSAHKQIYLGKRLYSTR